MNRLSSQSTNRVDEFQKKRHNQLVEAHGYLQEGKEIPDKLLAELGITGKRITTDSPDLDTMAEEYKAHVIFIHNYKMLLDEIRMTCLA